MQKSESEQTLEELSAIIAVEKGYDSKVIDAIIRHQSSFVLKAISEYKNVRLYKFGLFYVKNRFREMLNEMGYARYFKGAYSKNRDRLLAENEEYLKGLEESNLEKARNRKARKNKSGEVCELSTS